MKAKEQARPRRTGLKSRYVTAVGVFESARPRDCSVCFPQRYKCVVLVCLVVFILSLLHTHGDIFNIKYNK